MPSLAIKKKRVYTTGEIARVCCVAPRTVSKWFDSGKLNGYRIPGSNDRRVRHADLLKFLGENKMDVPDCLVHDRNVIFLTRDMFLVSRVEDDLSVLPRIAATGFEAGSLYQQLAPLAALILDTSIGRDETLEIMAVFGRLQPGLAPLVIVQEDEARPQIFGNQNNVFRRPFDPVLLVERIESLIGAEVCP